MGRLAHTHEALEPPIWAVKSVGVIRSDHSEAGCLESLEELAAPVDTNVASGDAVVVLGQRPVDELGPEAWDGHGHATARLENPRKLGHGGPIIDDVLEHLSGDHAVKAGVGERQPQGITLHFHRGSTVGCLTRLGHGRHEARNAFQLDGIGVESYDGGAAAEAFESMPAGSAAQIENSLSS